MLPVFSCDSDCVFTKSNKGADDSLKCASFLLVHDTEKLFDSLLEGTHLHLWKALTDLFLKKENKNDVLFYFPKSVKVGFSICCLAQGCVTGSKEGETGAAG